MESSRSLRKHSRSRTGCDRCKLKRLKCDETKPDCFQCHRRKISCPGYHTKIRWAADSQRPSGRSSESAHLKYVSDTDKSPNVPHVISDLEGTSYVPSPPAIPVQVTLESFAGSAAEIGPLRLSSPTNSPSIATTISHSSPSIYISSSENVPSRMLNLVSASLHENDSSCDVEEHTRYSFLPRPSGGSDPSCLSPLAHKTAETHRSDDGSITSDLPAEDKFLLQHYFAEVCPLNSAFDSPTNPFRYMISDLVVDSPLILNCVLGLSARWEVQRNGRFLSTAVHHHSAAVGHLSDILSNIQRRDTSLLHGQAFPPSSHEYDQIKQAIMASILLGISSCWLDGADNGLQHLLGARRLFTKWQSTPKGNEPAGDDAWAPAAALCDPEKSFIIGALAYWEAILAFVVDQPLDVLDYLAPYFDESSLSQVYLNPWSGICTPIFISLAQVGILARQKRLLCKMRSMGWNSSIDTVSGDLLEAAIRVEQQVLQYQIHPKWKTCDTGDPRISLAHLENYAHCYQTVSLLELYRSFPELFTPTNAINKTFTGFSLPSSSPLAGHNSPNEGTAHGSIASKLRRDLLLDMASTIMLLIDTAPKGSGISIGYTLAAIICGSVFFTAPEDAAPDCSCRTAVTRLIHLIERKPIVIYKWRESLRTRLSSIARITGHKSAKKAEQLLNALWEKADDACHLQNSDAEDPLDIHWLDVMGECKLEAVYG